MSDLSTHSASSSSTLLAMDALLMFQWMMFVGAALAWMTVCGTNLLLVLSDRDGPLIPIVGALAGATAALLLPETLAISQRLLIVGLLVCADPFWLSPILQTRSWLHRR